MKVDWKKVWRAFDRWADGKETYEGFPKWPKQKKKIMELVSAQLSEKKK